MRRLLAALVVLVVATSCSGDDDDSGSEPQDLADTAETTASTTTAPTTTTTQPALGALQQNDGGTVVALAYDQPVADEAPSPSEAGYPDGYVWSALDVEVCVPAVPAEYAVSSYLWALAMPDNSIVEQSNTGYTGFPKPEYPVELRVSTGQCVRGWITFAVPGDQRPTGVQYTPTETPPIKWSL